MRVGSGEDERARARRDELRRKEGRGVLKLCFLWVCGPFAFRKNINIVLKPIILCVCGPRTKLRVAFALWFKAIELQTHNFLGFKLNFEDSLACMAWPQAHIFLSLGLDLIIFQKSSSLPSTDMQDAKNSALQNREFGKRFRTTSGSPKLR